MKIGYCRVSADEKSLDLQRDALSKAGCKKYSKIKLVGQIAVLCGWCFNLLDELS